ncbi:MAG: hypothetical protein JXA67_19090, partial [Micromonosporaceae bacterium]|nr:hypothetical protein [Micromonosporaceae bacterium]
SWLSPSVMAVLRPIPAGVLALVASTLALALLLVRHATRRPAAGALLGAVSFAGNLVTGRVTFALGVAFGLWSLVALGRWRWLVVAGALAASATSPVAGLFLALVGTALCCFTTYRGDGITITIAAACPIGLAYLLSGSSGTLGISPWQAILNMLLCAVVAVFVPIRVIRIGAALAAATVLSAWVVPSPVGANATRLATMFALPLLAACGTLPVMRRTLPVMPCRRLPRLATAAGAWLWLAPLLAGLSIWQPPVVYADLADVGNPTASRSYFEPLLRELAQRRPIGRIEVPPTRDHWEAVHVANLVPLARGWLSQADRYHNQLFFGENDLTADTYRTWLHDNGVSYVALPDAVLAPSGRQEAILVSGGLDYLWGAWRGEHWVLYKVAGNPSVVDGGQLVESTSVAVTFDAAAPGEVLVRVRSSPWFRVRGPAPARLSSRDGWTAVLVGSPGRYTITSWGG